MAKKFKSKLIAKIVKDAEATFKATVITFESQFDNPKKLTEPGGMCSCCGAGPHVADEYDWWLVLKAGLDSRVRGESYRAETADRPAPLMAEEVMQPAGADPRSCEPRKR